VNDNPYASPSPSPSPSARARALREVPTSEVPDPAPLGTIMLADTKDKEGPAWRLALGEDEAWLVPPRGDRAVVLTQEGFAERCTVLTSASMLFVGVREYPGRGTMGFRAGAPAADPLRTWMARRADLHLRRTLERRLRYSIPLGLFLVLSALPILGPRLDPLVLVAGVGCVGMAWLGPRHPRPWIVLLDGIVWVLLAASNALPAYRGSRAGLVFAVLCGLFAMLSFRVYRFHRDLAARAPASR
jgi:hypothetical protein